MDAPKSDPGTTLTFADAEARVAAVKAADRSRDREAADGIERDLWRDALRAIRDGSPIAASLARLVLESSTDETPRWFTGR